MTSSPSDFYDLTILIPVRDRQYNIESQIEYYKDFNCKKIIVDTSIQEVWDKSIFENTGFEYYYYEPTTYIKKMKRINDEIIKTDFIVWVSDDDRAVKSCLKESIFFLRENPSYSVCHGKYFSGEKEIYVNGHRNMLQKQEQLNVDSPSDRLSLFTDPTNPFYPSFHAVIRTSAWRILWDMYYENENMPIEASPTSRIGHDYASNMVFIILGKIKALSSTYMIRDVGVKGISEGRLFNNINIRNELQLDKLRKIRSGSSEGGLKPIINLLSEQENISYEESLKIISDSFKKFFGADLITETAIIK
jgi:glycosyltransferase domain-containing protein